MWGCSLGKGELGAEGIRQPAGLSPTHPCELAGQPGPTKCPDLKAVSWSEVKLVMTGPWS